MLNKLPDDLTLRTTSIYESIYNQSFCRWFLRFTGFAETGNIKLPAVTFWNAA